MHFLHSFALATTLYTAQLSSAAAIFPKPTPSSSAAPAEFPTFPFRSTTVQNISSFLNIVAAIPDDVLASDESLADYFTEKSKCLINHNHKSKRGDPSANHPRKKPEQPKNTPQEPGNPQGKGAFSWLGFSGKKPEKQPEPKPETTPEKDQGSKGFRFPGFSGKKPEQESEPQPGQWTEVKPGNDQAKEGFSFLGSGKQSGKESDPKPDETSKDDQGKKGFSFFGLGKQSEKQPDPKPDETSKDDQGKKGFNFFGLGKQTGKPGQTTSKSPQQTNDVQSSTALQAPTMTPPPTPEQDSGLPAIPAGVLPAVAGALPAIAGGVPSLLGGLLNPDEATPTPTPTPTPATDLSSHTTPGGFISVPTAALPKISAAIANYQSRMGGAKPTGGMDTKLYDETMAAIDSLIAPFASAVIDKIEHKITAAPPSATGLAGDFKTAVPAFNTALAGFLDGIVLKQRDEKKCLEAEKMRGIKGCVDALATSPASKQLVALKAALLGAGGVAKVEAGARSLTLEHPVLSVLKRVAEVGKEVGACQILA